MKQAEQKAMLNTIDLRTDSFDVLNYQINAAFLNYQSAKDIDATCKLQIVQKTAASHMRLDLKGLNVSDVKINGNSASFSYGDPSLQISLPAISIGDTFIVEVSYNGNPQKDPQWGGFYFTGEYAFNLGVGFASDPHNFGRVWYPCFDNFPDRATYDYNITVDSGYKAYCNGQLTNVTSKGNSTQTFHWVMSDPIPTYLASVAIAKYEEVTMNVEGIPVVLTSLEKDTADMRQSFVNLPQCISQYVSKYGSHSFSRIGFNMVPFNSGAMEHATNIAYPVSTISGGTLNAETLYAHELAHHWWGNTITCRTQEDMWLNEGWASYSESLLLEAVYGKGRYDNSVELNHRDVLQFAHIRDGESLPVSGIGHANTYGNHVYNKGADMVHTLRGMMGDVAFFRACKAFQTKYKFKDVSTQDMHTTFQKETTVDLSGFFNQWIKKKGFAHFDIISVQGQRGDYTVRIKQTPRFNEEVYSNVPVTISAFSKDFVRFDEVVVINSVEESFDFSVPFQPEFWAFDYDDKISDATTTATLMIDKEGGFVMQEDGLIELLVDSLADGDSFLFRVEHHWAPADGTYGVPAGVVLSPQRFWDVDGIWLQGVNLRANLTYSGIQTTSSSVYGYLDNELIRITEDSLVLLYRPNGTSAWVVYSDYEVGPGSAFDKKGTVNITNLRKGQYAFGMRDSQLASGKMVSKPHANFKIFPNPVDKELTVQFEEKHDCCILEITNMYGAVVKTQKIKGKKLEHSVDVSELAPGNYFVGIITENLGYNAMRFVVK